MKGAILEHMAARAYRLMVEGELSDRLAVACEGVTITRSQRNTAPTGQMRDQAEFQGVMQRMSALGLTLLEGLVGWNCWTFPGRWVGLTSSDADASRLRGDTDECCDNQETSVGTRNGR